MPVSSRLFARGVAVLALLVAGPLQAREWTHSVTLPSALEYDSNVSMAAKNASGITRAILTPTYNLTGTFGNDEFRTVLGARVERSSDERVSADRNDPNMLFGWRRALETGEVGLNYRYDKASQRATQLEETGARASDGTRSSQSLAGNWRRALSDKDTFTLGADYSKVSFDQGTSTNYTNTGVSLNYGRQWSERIEPFVQTTASHYEPERKIVSPSDNYTLQFGVNYKASENFSWTGQMGVSRVEARSSDSSWLGSFILRYNGERHDVSLDLGRSVAASGEGGFVQSDYVRAMWSYALGERNRIGADASWRDSQGTQPNTYTQLGVWFSHELSPFWTARTYATLKQRDDDRTGTAHGNVIGISLVYSHPDF